MKSLEFESYDELIAVRLKSDFIRFDFRNDFNFILVKLYIAQENKDKVNPFYNCTVLDRNPFQNTSELFIGTNIMMFELCDILLKFILENKLLEDIESYGTVLKAVLKTHGKYYIRNI